MKSDPPLKNGKNAIWHVVRQATPWGIGGAGAAVVGLNIQYIDNFAALLERRGAWAIATIFALWALLARRDTLQERKERSYEQHETILDLKHLGGEQTTAMLTLESNMERNFDIVITELKSLDAKLDRLLARRP
jgi:hypothetical protein